MANYSDSVLDFSDCIDRLQPAIPEPGQPNPCVPWPSSFNPYKVKHIQEFKISMLQEIITNRFFGVDLNLCYAAASILPDTFIGINNVTSTPQYLNLPVMNLYRMAQHTLPSPVNDSVTPVDVMGWWWNSTVNDTEATSQFLHAVADDCIYAICDSFNAVGDQDITGIGMLISTAMLIGLAIVFATPSLFDWKAHPSEIDQPQPKKSSSSLLTPDAEPQTPVARLRSSLVGTLDDLLSALIIFTLSVLISSLVLRLRNDSLYDIFTAEALSLISASATVMIAAAYWRQNRARPAALAGFVADALLTIILFGIEFWFQHWPGSVEGLPREHRCLLQILGGPDLNNLGGKREAFPACFTLWLLALAGSLLHLPWVRTRVPVAGGGGGGGSGGGGGKTGRPSVVYRVLALSPMVFGTATILWLCVLFYNTWRQMRDAYGEAFTANVQAWGFGQFLALATWIPPILTFIHLLFAGMKKALTSRLPKGWVALIQSPVVDGANEERDQALTRGEAVAP